MIKIGNNISRFSTYSCQPKTREELVDIIITRVSKEGLNCNLNDVDTSLITDMSWIFSWTEFNGNISNWNVSNVINMSGMFDGAIFNQDISNWKINKDCDIDYVFYNCPIKEEYKPKSLKK